MNFNGIAESRYTVESSPRLKVVCRAWNHCTGGTLLNARFSAFVGLCFFALCARADEIVPVTGVSSDQAWSLHLQSTGIIQRDSGFTAKYSGPNSLDPNGETKHTLSFDLYVGRRLWAGGELHLDALAWQGYGLSNAVGAEGFPNGEAFRLGTNRPDAILARAFIRQNFALSADEEDVEDDALDLGGKRPVSRITVTAGKFSAKDVFDNNSYANDARTQFMNWAFMANEGWDYPADSIGFETGLSVEVIHRKWAIRYGLFQMPDVSNGMSVDAHLLKAWGMVLELERSYKWNAHPGVARLLLYENQAHMGSYQAAIDSPERPANIMASRAYRGKHGAAINLEQEIAEGVGVFSRLGLGDGRNEAWCFSDVDRAASIGISSKGASWGRKDDTFGLACVVNGISSVHRAYFAAGGTGILAGDGALDYGAEHVLESYYEASITKWLRGALDYQFISHPAFNQARGPVSVFGTRFRFEY